MGASACDGPEGRDGDLAGWRRRADIRSPAPSFKPRLPTRTRRLHRAVRGVRRPRGAGIFARRRRISHAADPAPRRVSSRRPDIRRSARHGHDGFVETVFCAPAASRSTVRDDSPFGRTRRYDIASRPSTARTTALSNYDTMVFFDAAAGITSGPVRAAVHRSRVRAARWTVGASSSMRARATWSAPRTS